MSKGATAKAFFKSVNAAPPAARAVRVGAGVAHKSDGGRGGGGESAAKTHAKNEIRRLNKHYRTELYRLEEASNNAEEGSAEQGGADLAWWAAQAEWVKKYKELAPAAGLKLTEEDERWIDAVGVGLPAIKEAWGVSEVGTPDVPSAEDAEPLVEEVVTPEQGTSAETKSFSELQQQYAAEMDAAKAETEIIDRKLDRIKWFRDEGQVVSAEDALLVASEGDLKEERVALGDRMEATRRAQQALGGGDEGVPARSAVPGRKPSGRNTWEGAPLLSTVAKAAAPAAGLSGVVASRLLRREEPAAPRGYLYAPRPIGGTTSETLAALTDKRDKMKKARKLNEKEIRELGPAIVKLTSKLMHQGRSTRGGLVENEAGDYVPSPGGEHLLLGLAGMRREDYVEAQALDKLRARHGTLLRQNEESEASYAQMERGISRMKSVLSDKSE